MKGADVWPQHKPGYVYTVKFKLPNGKWSRWESCSRADYERYAVSTDCEVDYTDFGGRSE